MIVNKFFAKYDTEKRFKYIFLKIEIASSYS